MNNQKQQRMRFILLLLGCYTVALAQGPEQAKYLLNQVSVEIKKQKNLRLEFQYVLENKEEQIKQETEGKVTLAGDQYKLEFLEVIQLLMVKKHIQLFLKTKKSRSVFQMKKKQ